MFDFIVMTTNDVMARDIGRSNGLIVLNQPVFEQTETVMQRVVRHALELHWSTYVMLLQPTSPFRTARHIREAWNVFDQSFPSDSLVSVNPNGRVNGAIYLFTSARIWRSKPIYDDDSLRYEMEFAASLDIDTETDLDLARRMVAHDPGQ